MPSFVLTIYLWVKWCDLDAAYTEGFKTVLNLVLKFGPFINKDFKQLSLFKDNLLYNKVFYSFRVSRLEDGRFQISGYIITGFNDVRFWAPLSIWGEHLDVKGLFGERPQVRFIKLGVFLKTLRRKSLTLIISPHLALNVSIYPFLVVTSGNVIVCKVLAIVTSSFVNF